MVERAALNDSLPEAAERLVRSARVLAVLFVLAGAGAAVGAWAFSLASGGNTVESRPLFVFLAASGVLVTGTLSFALAHVLARLRAVQAAMERLMTTDLLTGLKNRYRMFEDLDRLGEAFSRYGTPYAVLMVDIDHFKRVNDRFGHAAGDDVLVGVARRIRTSLRGADECYRYGGEEFVVLAPHTTAVAAQELAERLNRVVRVTPFRAGTEDVEVTISLGVAATDNGGDRTQGTDLLDRADRALYEAKAAGRNCVVVG